ncbi:hypothetical protein [Variovorax sp. Sphag1AA]|uniref:hypothetical protein n=1 Tax=Variovorax sp. Sphag1AA TaxID=2587027 RepID=UPI00160ABE37|nr:hypothetical protein [Variovorax sp. Sphag1AA]MBB3177993.1 hypothetical protein [Variovorax sp. Sphag1AA]
MRDPTGTSSASPTLPIAGRLALMAGHCAGMLDLVALPLWVGALITAHGLDPQQSGGVSLFLMGVVLASVATAPLLARIAPRAAVPLGFAVSCGVLPACAELRAPRLLAALHFAAGLGTHVALSMVTGPWAAARTLIGYLDRPSLPRACSECCFC